MEAHWCTFGANYLPLRTVWGKYSNKKRSFVYRTKELFLNDVFHSVERDVPDGVMFACGE